MNKGTATAKLWASGFVNRWHTFPDARLRNAQDTTAAHSQRVAILVRRLGEYCKTYSEEDVMECVCEALVHDAHEVVYGDIPYTAKRDIPGLREQEAKAAEEWHKDLRSVDGPDGHMDPLIKLADRLDAYLFAMAMAPDIVHTGPWRDMKEDFLDLATDLGLLNPVLDIIKAHSNAERF